jgi:hypothetical protein
VGRFSVIVASLTRTQRHSGYHEVFHVYVSAAACQCAAIARLTG